MNFSERTGSKYPADSYAFLSIHGPIEQPAFFAFGVMVWIFQISFSIMMVMRVADGNDDIDNPDEGLVARFIPSNVSILSRFTQYMALLSYCIFADASVLDVVKAVETFPNSTNAKSGDRIGCMIFSCVLRLSQGLFATIVALLLVIQTQDVIDIILNFTAVNFVSCFDEVAFELAKAGKYGPRFKAEAIRIEGLSIPECIHRKREHIRYRYTVFTIAAILMTSLSAVVIQQNSKHIWRTQRFRVQFEDGSALEDYSGCYELDFNSASWSRRRDNYVSFKANNQNTTFGYCKGRQKWLVYEGDHIDPCDAEEEELVAYSSRTTYFDISSSFEDAWYSRGRPLQLYFFRNDISLTDSQCSSFIGDGICNSLFNLAEYAYDEGDCCSSTCITEAVCGVEALKNVFDTNIVSGDGYPDCKNPLMKPITIYLNNVYVPRNFGLFSELDPRMGPPREPHMILDCDDTNVLTVSISKDMARKTETVMVADGANCTMIVQNSTVGGRAIFYVDYTIFHGDKDSIGTDPIIITQGDSYENSVTYFQRIEDCFLTKLGDHVDKATVYTGTGPSNQAIRWLMEDSKGHSRCERNEFLERYALTVINFAAPMNTENEEDEIGTNVDEKGLWINKDRHCLWQSVSCTGSVVTELNYDSLVERNISGTIATEIGLLKHLSGIGLGACNLYGGIPSQIGQLSSLNILSLKNNNLSGSIPTEIGALANLTSLVIGNNFLSGSIPTQIGDMSSLELFYLASNNLTGSIPSEIGQLSNMIIFDMGHNSLTGTIPTEVGELNNVGVLSTAFNSITGTIPTELGALEKLGLIDLTANYLVGSVPLELLYSENLLFLNVYGNELSNLTPVDDRVICSDLGGEHYCDCIRQCIVLPGEKNSCACEEAQTCCSSLLEQYDPCIVCENGLENPEKLIADQQTTCSGFVDMVQTSILDFASADNCTIARLVAENMGCRCKGGTRKCAVCESGLENPGFFVDDYNYTCSEAKEFAAQNLALFDTESKCTTARIEYREKGCRCKNLEEEPVLEEDTGFEEEPRLNEKTECIICEFGLANPDFFLEDSQMSCMDASVYIQENTGIYGTERACDITRVGLTEAGCKCKDNNISDLEEHAECVLCEFGLENPNFYLDSFEGSCFDASRFLKENVEGAKSACDEDRFVLMELGCECKAGES